MSCDVVLVNLRCRGALRAEHLGLGYLAACLRQAGVRTQVIDAHLLGASDRQIAESVWQAAPRLVGISATQPQGRAMVGLAEGVRAKLRSVHITAGGHFATFCQDRLLRDAPALDSVVRGEGDVVFADLVRRVLGGGEWRGLPGVSFRQDGAVVSTPPGPLVANLDDLPFPARDTATVVVKSGDPLGLSSSRGCHGRCTFCSISAFYGLQSGPAWRARSPENVVEEMAGLVREYGCNSFRFYDDTFVGPGVAGRERAQAMADAVLRAGLTVEFAVFSRTVDVDRDLFRHLQEAGLRAVEIGVESASQRQLDRFRKGTEVEDARRAISTLRDLGIEVCVSLIMFDPDSRLDECLETLRFVATTGILRSTQGFTNTACPRDGTELCEQLRRQGRLRGSYLKGYSYPFRDPAVALCARVVPPLARVLGAAVNPFTPRRRRPAAR